MGLPNPLIDTLFRARAAAPAAHEIVSAAPARSAGTRSRAGNSMHRTRAALLDGARRAVEVSGTRITMAQVAAAAGVAKATLYNHFRTRDAVLAALVEDEVRRLTLDSAAVALPERLVAVATHLAAHPVLRQLAADEPATLAAMARLDPAAGGWRVAREAVTDALNAEGRAGADLVLRWLSSYLVSPAAPAEIADDVAVLMAGLPLTGLPLTDQPGPTQAGPPRAKPPLSGRDALIPRARPALPA